MAAHLRDTWEDAVAPPPRQHVMQANGRPFGWHTMHAGPPPGGAGARVQREPPAYLDYSDHRPDLAGDGLGAGAAAP